MKEIFLWSRPQSEQDAVADLGLVNLWWGTWIAGSIATNISTRIESPITTVLAGAMGVFSALVAVRLVNTINELQRRAAQSVSRAGHV